MSLTRRHALVAALAAPGIGAAQGQRLLRYVPQADLASLDPIWTTATVTLIHGFMVFDTLYAMDAQYEVHPQMAAGHLVEDEGRRWTITLRDGLRFHDGEPVRARDCVASIRRWAQRDMFGAELLAVTDEIAARDDRDIVFRLKRPFPLLPRALGKVTSPLPAIMPERLAQTDPHRQVAEMIGSGPYRFLANERLAGARVAYARFEGYQPRGGTPSRSAGPKRAHFDRVEWHVLPDPSTAAAALLNGEVDWLEIAQNDLAPMLRRNRNVALNLVDDRSSSVMRLNHLHPPFDNPAIRRAILPALRQEDFMTAAFGSEAGAWNKDVGCFLSGTPMASDAGLEALRSPRSVERARAALAEAGYRGERVVMLQANDFPLLKAFGEVGADLLQRIGMHVDVQGGDWGTIVQRRARREPAERGGWNVFFSGFSGAGTLDPVAHLGLRAHGAQAWFGWPDSPTIEALRRDWLDAPSLAEQQRICRDIQARFFEDLPYIPIGEYYRLTAHRRGLLDFPTGLPAFWGVRRA
ncbi:MAG: ABC transporter substrate-binding protein [Acetobacteraceae bacterium]|nr:ABC transporter substrate-binding protein [Acetobacteraceae bacterium]